MLPGNPSGRYKQTLQTTKTQPKPNQGTKDKLTLENLFLSVQFRINLGTDLRAAGLPAELKHITQRRKRKQP